MESISPCYLHSSAAVTRCCFAGGPGCAALALLSVRPGNVELELAAASACWLPGCAAPAELSEFCGWPRRMFTMEVPRCRLAGMPGYAAVTLSKGRLPVHPTTAGCSALLTAPASAASCSALLAVAPVRASRLARHLLPSVMTFCCNSVIKVGNGRRCLCSYCCTSHAEKRWDTSLCRGLDVFVSNETAARSV